MTGTAILNMLLGAALVVLGVLVVALADRIRGLRVSRRDAEPRERAGRAQVIPARAERAISAHAARAVIPVIEAVEASPKPRIPVVEIVNEAQSDIVAALVQAGYKKAVAVTAASSCLPTERIDASTWLKAALHRAQHSS